MKTQTSLIACFLLGLPPAFSQDSRLDAPLTLDSYHPFRTVPSPADWPERQAEIRLQTQVAAGLWPMPEKTPLQATVHGIVDRGDFTVSRVMLQSLPGHYVTGSLFQPAGASLAHGLIQEKRPGVLCPHGHWKDGRFYDAGEVKALQDIATGAERFLTAARNPVVARCVQLARMGCVVFLYDMLGYADSIQFPSHRTGPRPHLNTLEAGTWGFVSPAAAARLQTNFGLQTWNSVRSLDFLLSLPGIDPARILVTGASGGATQTMILAAIDGRVSAAFPCVMASTAMQGGCTCENSHYLRIGQGNIDIAAAFAPKPLGLTSADDWTVELETKGHPDLQALYRMLGAPSNYEAHFNTHFKHNYNHVSRTQMYQFVNRHFQLGFPSPVLEKDYEPLEKPDLTVWSGAFPAPAGEQTGEPHEKAVCRWWTEDAARQIDSRLSRNDRTALLEAQAILRPAMNVLIGRGLASCGDVSFDPESKVKAGSLITVRGVIRNTRHREEVPALILYPGTSRKSVILWLTAPGASPKPDTPIIQRLLSQGSAILFPELFGPRLEENPRSPYPGDSAKPENQWKHAPVYQYGYNHPLFARRVHDILTTIAFVKSQPEWKDCRLHLAGLEGTGHYALASLAVAGSAVERAVADTRGFRFSRLNDPWHADFLPGASKYGDLSGMISLAAPQNLWIAGQDASLQQSAAALYQLLGAAERFRAGEWDPEALAAYLAPPPS